MAVSQTSFDQRITRINKGDTVDVATFVGKGKKRRSLRARCMTLPFFTGVGILTGLPGYAFVSEQPDMTGVFNANINWVLAEMQSLLALVG